MARHLLFVALAGHGHVIPTLPLVEKLAPSFSQTVTGAGARWVALPPLEPFHPSTQSALI